MKLNLILLLAFSLVFAKSAASAEISETGKDSTTISECSMVVKGEIAKGDAARIEALLVKWNERQPNATHLTKYAGLDYVVCLSGSSGDYREAIRVAEVFASKVVATSVPEGASCTAACAIAFLGGKDCCVEMGQSMVKRHLSQGSSLGLGAPTLKAGQETYTSREISETFNQSLDVITELQNKADVLGIDSGVIDNLVSHRNGNYLVVRPDSAHKHNYLNSQGKVFQDIWVPFVSGVVNQGTQDQ